MTKLSAETTSNHFRSDRLTPDEWAVVDAFHRLYYESRLCLNQTWLGVHVLKNPFDLLSYQEVLVHAAPTTLVETGTAWGGSALFFATVYDLLGYGQVLSVDRCADVPALYRWAYGEDCQVPRAERPRHPRITYVTGDVLDPRTVRQVQRLVRGPCMVSLDSHHDAAHVLAEVRLWSPLVTPGQYLVVEDTNMGGHPVQEPPWDGPYEALSAWLAEGQPFALDWSMGERHLMSFNSWLVRLEEER
jgi:cephalosporin hydroxylase